MTYFLSGAVATVIFLRQLLFGNNSYIVGFTLNCTQLIHLGYIMTTSIKAPASIKE